jgi:hypothetical protein
MWAGNKSTEEIRAVPGSTKNAAAHEQHKQREGSAENPQKDTANGFKRFRRHGSLKKTR